MSVLHGVHPVHAAAAPVRAATSGTALGQNLDADARRSQQFTLHHVIGADYEGAAEKWLSKMTQRREERTVKLRENLKQKLREHSLTSVRHLAKIDSNNQQSHLANNGGASDLNNNFILPDHPLKQRSGFETLRRTPTIEHALIGSTGQLSLPDRRPIPPSQSPQLPQLSLTNQKQSGLEHSNILGATIKRRPSMKAPQAASTPTKDDFWKTDNVPMKGPAPRNTTIPLGTPSETPIKLYPENPKSKNGKKSSSNYCLLADAPYSFANHYLQEKTKEQLDYRAICATWLQSLKQIDGYEITDPPKPLDQTSNESAKIHNELKSFNL